MSSTISTTNQQLQIRRRMSAHRLAQVLMTRGEYQLATDQLQMTQYEHGDHVLLLADLVCCHYMLNRISDWQLGIRKLAETLLNVQYLLSHETRVKSYVVLAKCYEEDAQLHFAQLIYQEELVRVRQLPGFERCQLERRLLIQLLRLKSLYQMKTGLGSYYTALMATNTAELSEIQRFEIEHALVLAELHLVGADVALSRLQTLLLRSELSAAKRSLVTLDVAQVLIHQKKSLPDSLLEIISSLEVSDSYEVLLKRFLLDGHKEMPWAEVQTYARDMSPANLLRLLTIQLQFVSHLEQQQLILKQIALLTERLDGSSRSIWFLPIQTHLPQMGVREIIIDLTKRQVCIEQDYIDFSRRPGLIKLLGLFAKTTHVSLDHAALTLFGQIYDYSHYDRLRMQAQRLNQLFRNSIGTQLVHFSSEGLSIMGNHKISLVTSPGLLSHPD